MTYSELCCRTSGSIAYLGANSAWRKKKFYGLNQPRFCSFRDFFLQNLVIKSCKISCIDLAEILEN